MTARIASAVFVDAVGVVGPGFADWPTARAVLHAPETWSATRTVIPQPSLLSPSERRRAGRVLRLAVAVATEAAGEYAVSLATVFASSGADGDNCHELCLALATPERAVSPTRFMNSVHNAPSGYWTLAAHAMRPSTAICAFDGSFAAGLLEAATQVACDGEPVLLVAYDADYPEPLRAKRPISDAFACALRLSPRQGTTSIARLEIATGDDAATRLEAGSLEALRRAIPAARALPLLQRLATGTAGRCVLDYLDGLSLRVEVTPC